MTSVSPILACAAAALVATGAWRWGALTTGGAVAAAAVGTAALSAGLPWAVLLLFFFVTSTALSRREQPGEGVGSMVRDGPRDA
ncbi:MAG TPA: DUF92 domain-containing protein, partial [Gemmatimonadaceae bacterium]